jgi:hypothetical protein
MNSHDKVRNGARSKPAAATPLSLLQTLRRSRGEDSRPTANNKVSLKHKRSVSYCGLVPCDLDRIARADCTQSMLESLNDAIRLLERCGWTDQLPSTVQMQHFESIGEVRSVLRIMEHEANAPGGQALSRTDAMVVLRALLEAAAQKSMLLEMR